MTTLHQLAHDFLAQPRIAVAGVSRSSKESANLIFRKLRESGRQVSAVNPRAQEVEGTTCYPNLSALPEVVDACVIATPPAAAVDIVEECAALGIGWVWMHRSFGAGSVSDAAVQRCHDHGIKVIAGACPMMFCEPVDFGHKCMRWMLGISGRLPRAHEPGGPRA